MKKKILGIFIVLVLMVCLFFVGSAVILFLAPGVEIFGIRYVPDGQSQFVESKFLDDLSGKSIYIETDGVPININYTTYYTSKVTFKQEFIGFTKSGYDEASVKVYLDDDKNIHIETQELVKWLYAIDNEKMFTLNIELSKVYAMNKNLYINSRNSSVNINGGATYEDVSIVTEGELRVTNGTISADNFKYHTNKMVTINESIVATNYDLKSTGSSITVDKEVVGDLTVQTKGGDIKFVSCENLNARTGGGSIRSAREGLNQVNKETQIVTDGGDVVLGAISVVDEMALCNIVSSSGDVKISTMKDGLVVSNRGDISIGKARAIIVNTKIGDISIDSVTNQIVVNGRNGNVSIGELGYVENVEVSTTTGSIDVRNAYGNVKLKSASGSVNLKNLGSENVVLSAGRNVTATGLKGAVDIYGNGDINVSFVGITDNVNVETGSKSNNIVVDAGETSYLDVDYNIYSSKGKKPSVYVGGVLMDNEDSYNTGVHEGKKLIKIRTSYAKVVLKLAV